LISVGLFSISWSRYNLKIATYLKIRGIKKSHAQAWHELESVRNNWRKRHGK
jgi:hypothetical protein